MKGKTTKIVKNNVELVKIYISKHVFGVSNHCVCNIAEQVNNFEL